MNTWLLTLVGLIYLWVAYGYFNNNNIGMGIAFIAYALANLGFIIANVQNISSS